LEMFEYTEKTLLGERLVVSDDEKGRVINMADTRGVIQTARY